MKDGSIVVSPTTHVEDRRAPVGIFFRTLAEEHGTRAIAVILSGTGANGSMGIKRVKEKGGLLSFKTRGKPSLTKCPAMLLQRV